jgi:hypothetical protein
MIDTSRRLENLASVSDIQSFFLAIDPRDELDPGFLGGSVQGRAFWRNLRGGGDQGAKGFKLYCAKVNALPKTQNIGMGSNLQEKVAQPTPGPSKQDAKTVKADLYDIVRKVLRCADHPFLDGTHPNLRRSGRSVVNPLQK